MDFLKIISLFLHINVATRNNFGLLVEDKLYENIFFFF